MKKLFLISLAALTLSACNIQFKDTVTINSNPQGAIVFINDEIMGVTPVDITLPNDGTYKVILVKEGYKNQELTVSALRDNPFVKFGPLVDMGYYKSLKASCDKNEMKPNFVPDVKSLKAFEDMQKNIDKADQMLKDGKISKQEHSYIVKKIIEFYSGK